VSGRFVDCLRLIVRIVNIPIIAVFTKYDLLVTQFWIQEKQSAEKNALDSFDRAVKEMQAATDLSIPCVKVSTKNTQRLFISPPPSPLIDTTHIRDAH